MTRGLGGSLLPYRVRDFHSLFLASFPGARHRKELTYRGFQPPFVIPPVQIRTCAANASGSCFESDAQTLIRIRVGCPYRRNV